MAISCLIPYSILVLVLVLSVLLLLSLPVSRRLFYSIVFHHLVRRSKDTRQLGECVCRVFTYVEYCRHTKPEGY